MQFDLPELIYEGKPALAPQQEDLERLYNLIIKHRATTVLEFGCGYSTKVIKDAHFENVKWFDSLGIERERIWFNHVCVDTNEEWIEECKSKIRIDNYVHSTCSQTTRNGFYCHIYTKLPNIIPDFIYLDGPDPMQVYNWGVNMPMSADILYLEPILLPGTVVVIDGRVNNARFLQRNLQRNWSVRMEDDVTIMELDEPRLGKINACGRDLREAVGE